MSKYDKIPIYSLDSFRQANESNSHFQVEVFDAHRHFQVAYPHRHDFYEVLYFSKGSGIHVIDNNEYEIKPPCVFFLSPGQAHKLDLSQDIEGYIFLFTSEFYGLFESNKNKLLEFPFFFSVTQKNPPLYIREDNDNTFLTQLFLRGCLEVKQATDISNEIMHGILHVLLLTCFQLYPKDVDSANQSKSQLLVKKFLLALEENYTKNISLDEYGRLLAITPNHLTQVVKSVMGKTPISIIQEKRVIEIKRLLLHTSMSVSEISDYLNFTDQSYFTKYFKKNTGLTPIQYRKQS
jgi:AraC-like DNA-binding protein/quercetin dioxygenase-like cupin family protein